MAVTHNTGMCKPKSHWGNNYEVRLALQKTSVPLKPSCSNTRKYQHIKTLCPEVRLDNIAVILGQYLCLVRIDTKMTVPKKK